jgi:hypothetical protein
MAHGCCVLDQGCSQLCSVVERVDHAGDVLPALVPFAKNHDGVTGSGTGDGGTDGQTPVPDLEDAPGRALAGPFLRHGPAKNGRPDLGGVL